MKVRIRNDIKPGQIIDIPDNVDIRDVARAFEKIEETFKEKLNYIFKENNGKYPSAKEWRENVINIIDGTAKDHFLRLVYRKIIED